nr:ABC transporter permease [uncultured Anaerostipes sp.]
MWKNYSESYLKHNRRTCISIMTAVFGAMMFLSLICTMAFNLWKYEIERIELEEGGWQGRIISELSENDIKKIQQFKNVERAELNEDLSDEKTVIDIYFKNLRTIYSDMPGIARYLGVEEEEIQYHVQLLSCYFITDPQDKEPPLLLPFCAVVLFFICLSLILIIRNSFEISMRARIRQFGILSGIGATPGQIRTCLLQEAAALSILPILLGTAAGIGSSYAVIKAVNHFAENVAGRHPAVFQYHPVILTVSLFLAAVTVLLSAWIPAVKLSRMTPMEAVRNEEGLHLNKRKRRTVLSGIFGIKGELAGNAMKAQNRAYRISNVSLVLSFLSFALMLCFFTLSDISTRYTYFERYQDTWDVMAEIKNTELADFDRTQEIRNLPGIRDSILYQKAEMRISLPREWQSPQMLALGGLEALTENEVEKDKQGNDTVISPVIIMDDESFLKYCREIGASPGLDGTIILNRIWDSKNSNFRDRKYIPFVKENKTAAAAAEEIKMREIPILAYTQDEPKLREEYADYALVQFMPLSLWERMGAHTGETTTYIRILGRQGIDLEGCSLIGDGIEKILDTSYDYEIENRIRERISNEEMLQGVKMIIGGFCILIAVIGIANIFSVTLGFVQQRKREFAQYLSVGMTPKDMRSVFCMEAFVTAGRPILITVPLTAATVTFMLAASHLNPEVFLREAPIIPVAAFAAVIIFFVGLAYFIGGRRVLNCDLSEILKDDTLN